MRLITILNRHSLGNEERVKSVLFRSSELETGLTMNTKWKSVSGPIRAFIVESEKRFHSKKISCAKIRLFSFSLCPGDQDK